MENNNVIDLTADNGANDDFDAVLPLIGSLDHALDLASKWAGISRLRFHEVDLALQWRLPLALKPASEVALQKNELQKLYTLEDMFKKMPTDSIYVVGQLKNVMMI